MNYWQFEELIDAINKPDWWIICITVINVAFMVCLGIKQNQLQKRMNLLSVYESYMGVYKIICEVEDSAKGMLVDIYRILSNPKYKKNFLERRISLFETLKASLLERELDLRIYANVDRDVIYSYEFVIDKLIELSEWLNNDINTECYTHSHKDSFRTFTDKVYKKNILHYIKDDKKEELAKLIDDFLVAKRSMMKCKISKKMLR